MKTILLALACWVLAADASAAAFQNPYGKRPVPATPGDTAFTELFKAEARQLSQRCLADIHSSQDWTQRKDLYRKQLFEMLSLDPLPPKTDLKPVVTGKLDHAEFIVEKLHFQSMPGLYVTANLYLPKNSPRPAPAILYVCGHSPMKTNGISFGNKAGYQHYGAWFARNGYACLVLDTVQLGEIEGIHHGTYREGMWWWNSRGYTSAGAEAWNCLRALDYLETRPEIDASRIGVTGRSGGGAYSWWIAALDERIKAACPVAGITDLENHVVDGVVEGHCDCMFPVNTYRWDFAQVAALVAPRPLLICNSDKDTIFPLDGVVRVHEKVRSIYQILGATDRLGLLITEGPHKDTQELQVPVLRWFNRFLKNDVSPIQNAAATLFSGQDLRVLDTIPSDQITSRCYEHFTRLAQDDGSFDPSAATALLRSKTFGGWPSAVSASVPRERARHTHSGLTLSVHEFEAQPGLVLRFYFARPAEVPLERVRCEVADAADWLGKIAVARAGFSSILNQEIELLGNNLGPLSEDASRELARQTEYLRDHRLGWIVLAPRAVGTTALTDEARYRIQVRRRFMLLGQTLAGMQVWDIVRGLEAVRALPEIGQKKLELSGGVSMTEALCYASLWSTGVQTIELQQPPRSDLEAPDFLNASRIVTPGQLLTLTRSRSEVRMVNRPR